MRHAQRDRDRPLWAMPILEGPDTAHRERRLDTLLGLKDLLAAYRDLVPVHPDRRDRPVRALGPAALA